MEFGIFYELQLPRPWEPDSEHKLYQNALTQVELADRLGYDYAWQVEHHFLEEYSHSPTPEMFLAAASQRTRQIKLAHGIMQLTTSHPARVAERVATLDLLSNGRAVFGSGESASITELEPFGRVMEDKRQVWEDGLRAVIPMFKDGPCEYDGPYFKMPLRNVLPKPLQRPHPPLWVACSQLETIEMAGRRGLGALAFHGFHYVPDRYADTASEMLQLFILTNLVLGLFNLIPLPPLDGGRIMVGILPAALARAWARLERAGLLLVLLLVFVLPQLLPQFGLHFDPVHDLLDDILPRALHLVLRAAFFHV